MNTILRAIWAAAAVCALLAAPAQGLEATVTLRPEGLPGTYRIDGEFSVQATPETVWAVLTDYDGIGEYVSSIKRSRVVRREPGSIVIEQEGKGRFFFVSRLVKLTLMVTETPPQTVEFRDVDGAQFRRYEGSWRITNSSSGCTVNYQLTAQPDPSLGPQFAAKKVLRKSAQRLLDEVRVEIERRARG